LVLCQAGLAGGAGPGVGAVIPKQSASSSCDQEEYHFFISPLLCTVYRAALLNRRCSSAIPVNVLPLDYNFASKTEQKDWCKSFRRLADAWTVSKVTAYGCRTRGSQAKPMHEPNWIRWGC